MLRERSHGEKRMGARIGIPPRPYCAAVRRAITVLTTPHPSDRQPALRKLGGFCIATLRTRNTRHATKGRRTCPATSANYGRNCLRLATPNSSAVRTRYTWPRWKRAAIAEKEELAAKANVHIDAVVAGVKFLHENGILPEKISGAFSRSDGMFVPATVLRNVTPEQLVGGPRRGGGLKRTRRVRDAAGNLVPSKASR